MTGERGIALILVVLVTSFLSAIGLGLALIVMMDHLATGNLRGSVAMLYAADAAIELSARELASLDWDRALTGEARSSFVDGAAGGVRAVPGGEIDLTAATNGLNCGQPAACSDGQMNQSTRERPWGQNNPRWQLFAHGPFADLGPVARPASCYLAVWIADDGGEEDGEPLVDAMEAAPGHGVLRIRAEAFGSMGSRRAIEAELVRSCPGEATETCPARIRVQSWSEVRQFVP
jgi:hypothetical protein